jgi:hypothetical protein
MNSDELRAELHIITGYSFEYLQTLTKDELERILKEKRSD